MKKILLFLLVPVLRILSINWMNLPKITAYYTQLTQPRVGLSLDLQPQSQKEAAFVGSVKCKECHKENYNSWELQNDTRH